MTYGVRFFPEAVDQLKALYGYLAEVSSPQVAAHYVEGMEAYCDGLGDFPHRGTAWEDLRPGLCHRVLIGAITRNRLLRSPMCATVSSEAGAGVPKG